MAARAAGTGEAVVRPAAAAGPLGLDWGRGGRAAPPAAGGECGWGRDCHTSPRAALGRASAARARPGSGTAPRTPDVNAA